MDRSDHYMADSTTHCQGAWHTDRYVLAMNVAIAKRPLSRERDGVCDKLDEILAFDLAEVATMHMGCINLMTVSSFCGPQGLVWGLDLAKAELPKPNVLDDEYGKCAVFDGDHLVAAARSLFGTLEEPRFNLAPGTRCPVAAKYVTAHGDGLLYATAAIGDARGKDGPMRFLMEDIGFVRPSSLPPSPNEVNAMITQRMVTATRQLARAQNHHCDAVHVHTRMLALNNGEVGCAGVFLPYIALAQYAVPEGGIDAMKRMSTKEWEHTVLPEASP